MSHKPPTWLQLRYSNDLNVPREIEIPFEAWSLQLGNTTRRSLLNPIHRRTSLDLAAGSVDIFNPFWTGPIVFVHPKIISRALAADYDLKGMSR